MAEIIGCMATTHGPQLHTTPDQWLARLPADHKNVHRYRDSRYTFDELVELRRDEGLEERSSEAGMWASYERCVAAMDAMADLWAEWGADGAVILGNDQSEVFSGTVIPSFMVYYGDTIEHHPVSEEGLASLPPGIAEGEPGHTPPVERRYPAMPDLGRHVIGALMDADFDVTVSPELPTDNERSAGIGHAFGHIYRKVMRDDVVPHLPVMQNTFFPPNQPTARRSLAFGRIIGEAIRSWDSDMRLVVFASGGMSHFCIDEAWDMAFMDAMREENLDYLSNIPLEQLQAGNSEMKNWISLAGLMEPMSMAFNEIDYVPCYRSPAGTGTAQGFYYWTPTA